MDIIYALILGAIQGVTEFLPISSTGHLVLASELLSFSEQGIVFEAVVHAGSALAILWYFRNKMRNLSINELYLVALASVPAFVVGVIFASQIESLFSVSKLLGFAFLTTALINLLIDTKTGNKEKPSALDAIIIGLFQAFAIIPGISRSASTIFAGTRVNLEKPKAAEFSFLMALPAIVGANVMQIFDHGFEGGNSWVILAAGFLAAFIASIFSMRFLLRMLVEKRLKFFSYYLIALGALIILV